MTFYRGQFLDYFFFLLLFSVLLIYLFHHVLLLQINRSEMADACRRALLVVCMFLCLRVCVPSVCAATTATVFRCDLSAANGLPFSAALAAIRSFISIQLHRSPPASLVHGHAPRRSDTRAPSYSAGSQKRRCRLRLSTTFQAAVVADETFCCFQIPFRTIWSCSSHHYFSSS